MKAAERMGLVGAGSADQSIAARMPSLHARLGPVKGVTFPAARRLVNALRAGFAVPGYGALDGCPAIWISVPEAHLDSVAHDLALEAARKQVVIIICDSGRESTSFEALANRGAYVATLNSTGEGRQARFVAEGHPEALRLLRKMFEEDKRILLELHPGAKAGYLAGIHLVTVLLRPWIASAVECLRSSGVSRADAVELVEPLALRTVRAQLKSGVRHLSASLEDELRRTLEREAEEQRPRLSRDARLYADGLRLALQYFQRRPRKKAASHHA